MKAKLKPLSKKDIKQLVPNFDIKELKKNERIFFIKASKQLDNPPLINLEISFRKCERLGVFEK